MLILFIKQSTWAPMNRLKLFCDMFRFCKDISYLQTMCFRVVIDYADTVSKLLSEKSDEEQFALLFWA